MVFEDGTPAALVDLRDRDGDLLAGTDEQGIARVGYGRSSIRHSEAHGHWRASFRRQWPYSRQRLWSKGWQVLPPGVPKGSVAPFALWSQGRALNGRVVDQHGDPVADARLLLTTADAQLTVTADGRGRFYVLDASPSSLEVEVDHPDCFREPMPTRIGEGRPGVTDQVTVVAVRGRHHTIHVRGDDDAPVAGATVEWTYRRPRWIRGEQNSWRYAAKTEPDGSARLLLVPGHDLVASISHTGFAERDIRGLAGLLPDAMRVQLRSERSERWVPLNCRDARTGDPVRPTRVLVRRVSQPWIVGEPPTGTRAAVCHPAQGPDFDVVDVENLPKGTWEIWCWAPGYVPRVTTARATKAGVYPPPDVRLQPGAGRVTVQVDPGRTGPLESDVSLTVYRLGEWGPFAYPDAWPEDVEVGADGTTGLDLPPGDYEVYAVGSGRASRTVAITVGPQPQLLTLRLRR